MEAMVINMIAANINPCVGVANPMRTAIAASNQNTPSMANAFAILRPGKGLPMDEYLMFVR